MNLHRRTAAFLLVVLAAGACLPASGADTVYQFSPVNQYGINVTAAYWNPIVNYVTEKSGVKLQLKIGRTSADTTSYVLTREVDFVFSNHLFSPEREAMGWKVFGRRDTPPVRGTIIVLEDSPVTDLKQLAGKSIAFPGPEATVSYKFTYAEVLSRGIAAKAVFAGNTDAAFEQLISGKAAAAGVNSQLAEGFTHRQGTRFRVLWASEPVHDLALMHSSKVPKEDLNRVEQAFIGMRNDPKGQQILKQVTKLIGLPGAAGFVASDGSEYAPYRKFYRSAPAELR